MSDIMTFPELQELSGYKIPSKVKAWLEKNHIPFILARNQRPVVNKDALAYKMGAPAAKPETNEFEPNFDAL